MRILYVTELWSGFEDFIVKGKTDITGMPAFMKPLKYFFESGELEIDFAIIGKDKRPLNIKATWLNQSDYFWVNKKSFRKVFELMRIIKTGNYDFVYGQGEGGGWANMAAIMTKTPFGMRYYGTFLSRYLNDSYFRFVSRNLLAAITYNLPKDFMLITNDGTKGDLVHQKLCLFKRFYPLYFWLNGVEKANKKSGVGVADFLRFNNIEESDLLFLYPARYDPWKRQNLALEIFHELNKTSNKPIKLLCCGHKYDQNYLDSLDTLAQKYDLSQNVIFEGAIDVELLKALMEHAAVVFSLYELSNLGNVLIEASLAGSQVVTVNDGTTSFLVEDGVSGISIKDNDFFVQNAAKRIAELLNNTSQSVAMRIQLKARANEVFTTWEERAQKEKELILAAKKNKPKGK